MTDPRRDVLGLAAIGRAVFEGRDVQPLFQDLLARAQADASDAAALHDLSTLLLLTGQTQDGLALQSQALALRTDFRRPARGGASLRLLAVMAPGDMMANTPVDFLLGEGVELTSLYVAPGLVLPQPLPEHDVAIFAMGESPETQSLLSLLAPALRDWPGPLLNGAAERIAALTRDGVADSLADAPGVFAPAAVRAPRADLAAWAGGGARPASLPAGPLVVRPLGSQAGVGLERIEDADGLGRYLSGEAAEAFYVSPFVDYSGPDGLFRKLRIALIGGRPEVCHMAVSPRWMVHYLNADMLENAENRAEEARMFETFKSDFAVRHARALGAIAERLGLDYVVIDCAETRDGRLLVFEADVAMIVHDMDPPDIFPYKAPQMRKVFAAFDAMLRAAAARVPAHA